MSTVTRATHDHSQTDNVRYQPYPIGPDAGIRQSTSRTNDRVPAPVGRGTSAVGLQHAPANAVQRPLVTTPVTPPHPLQATLDRIITGINEISLTLTGVQLEQQRQATQLNDLLLSSFTIEKSSYKDELLMETGLLFCKTLNRKPDRKSILLIVAKVLKGDFTKKYKKDAASVFMKSRLGELRAEVRRRVLGQGSCLGYLSLSCEQFVDKFLPSLKVEREAIPLYPSNVAILRKYCRSVLNSKEKTYKGLDVWLKMHYQDGIPSVFQLQSAMEEEDAFLHPPAEFVAQNSPSYVPIQDGIDDGHVDQ